jgi:hypothetical protein
MVVNEVRLRVIKDEETLEQSKNPTEDKMSVKVIGSCPEIASTTKVHIQIDTSLFTSMLSCLSFGTSVTLYRLLMLCDRSSCQRSPNIHKY